MKSLVISMIFMVALGSISAQQKVPFGVGEEMTYKVHYGFINAADAFMKVKPKLETLQGRKCYHVVIQGNSVGMFDLFMRIRDTWGTFIDKDLIVPRRFYQKIREGKYRKREIVDFDIDRQKAAVRRYDHDNKKWKPTKKFDTPANVQDLISSYYYLRTLDFDQYAKGDTITTQVFFDEELYQFKVRYIGKESLKTKVGRYHSIVLSPIMPENKLFDGEDSIKVWLSDDSDKIPLKVKAKMFIGAVEIDIKKYKKGKKYLR